MDHSATPQKQATAVRTDEARKPVAAAQLVDG
jgi:hypothetical protein